MSSLLKCLIKKTIAEVNNYSNNKNKSELGKLLHP